ncbi:MAG: BON domain-containing protein [Pelagibacteraceae bacterium]|nr:BON domain-containing protein [Pelagibacteraceae bacterium]PHX89053.1 MAG: phospholipid-binding protein [Pelagibacteraceae bacterium]
MKFRFILIILAVLTLIGCVGVSSKGLLGTGVSIAFDPRSVGTQIDDSIMQKNLIARNILKDPKYFLSIRIKVLDGRIFLKGKVDGLEEKLILTKLAWETDGVRSVRNDIKIKEDFKFKQSSKDFLISTKFRAALLTNKDINSTNYQIEVYKQKIYLYGIALTVKEKKLVLEEANKISDIEDVIESIILVEDLRIQKN